MSSGTNQTRIEQNNLKLDQIKTKVDNLPEYQDIEPIYGDEFVAYEQSNFPNSTVTKIGDIIYYRGTSNTADNHSNYFYVYKDNGNSYSFVCKFYNYNSSGNYVKRIIDYDDEYIYYVDFYSPNYSTTLQVKRHLISGDPSTNDENYWSAPLATNTYMGYVKIVDKKLLLIGIYSYLFNCKDKIVTTLGYARKSGITVYDASCIYNNRFAFFNQSDANILYNCYTGGYNSNFSGIIHGVTLDQKLILGQELWTLSDTCTLLEKICDLVIENYNTNMTFICLSLNDFYEVSSAKLYRLDNNNLSIVEQLPNNYLSSLYNYNISFKKNNINYIFKNYSSKRLLGYNISGNQFYLNNGSIFNSNLITNDYLVYNKYGAIIKGTMPNNGALNYTPSTSQQTIPAGYTSGGTIEAVSMSEEDIENAIAQAEDILD